jgi:hypothetical protein
VILAATVGQWPPLTLFPPEIVVTSIPNAHQWAFGFQNIGATPITIGWRIFLICTPLP